MSENIWLKMFYNVITVNVSFNLQLKENCSCLELKGGQNQIKLRKTYSLPVCAKETNVCRIVNTFYSV